MLVGPSSQLIVEDAGVDPDGLDDAPFIADIEQRRDRIEHPAPIESRGDSRDFWAYDDI